MRSLVHLSVVNLKEIYILLILFSCKRQYMSSKWRKLFERSYDIAAARDAHQMNLKHFESLNNTVINMK